MNTAVEIIKQTLSMHEVVEHYGFTQNRAGFISCPFHSEKTASLKIFKDGGWKCFGCGRGNSVIDFVMQLFGINFQQALIRISSDFGLNIINERPDPREVERYRRERAARELAELERQAVYRLKVLEYARLWQAYKFKRPESDDERFNWEFVEALRRLRYLEYWFSVN